MKQEKWDKLHKELDDALYPEFGKAKLPLRKYISDNKEKVTKNLEQMRKISNRIVTFDCSNKIYIYEKECGKLPNPPYKKHDNIDSAVFYMSQILGINNIEIVLEKKL